MPDITPPAAPGALTLAGATIAIPPTADDPPAPLRLWTARTMPATTFGWYVAYGGGMYAAVGYSSTAALSSPDGITWTARTLPVFGNWGVIAYGNGMFVAAQTAQTYVLTSPDGITWTQRVGSLPASANWNVLNFSNGQFLLMAGNSAIAMTSPDGITWTQRAMPSASPWSAVAYGGGQYVAVCTGSTVTATSPDGITWTQRAIPGGASMALAWAGIAYGNGMFLAVVSAAGTTYATTPDGITWTARTFPVTYASKEIAFGGATFAVINTNTSPNAALFTADGITWTAYRTLTTTLTWRSLIYAAGQFSAFTSNGANVATLPTPVGEEPGGVAQYYLYGADPAPLYQWSGAVMPSRGTYLQWYVVMFGNGWFVASAYDSNNTCNWVATSPDGINWTQRATVYGAFPIWGLAYGAGLYVAVASGTTATVWTTADPNALTWTARASALPAAANWQCLVYLNGQFIAWSTTPATSPDGITWTARTLPGAVTAACRSIAYGAGLYVAACGSTVMTSPDGITWTARTPPAAVTYVAYGNGLFVGTQNAATSLVMTSPDGITWTQRASLSAAMGALVFASGAFLSVPSTGLAGAVSTDGVNWSPRALPAAAAMSAAVGGGVAVTVNSSTANLAGWMPAPASASDVGVLAVAPPVLTTWSRAALATTVPIYAAVYGGGQFLAVATSGQVTTSPDGITWTARTTNLAAAGSGTWQSVAYGNGVYLLMSTGGSISTSPDGIVWTTRTALSTAYAYQSVTYGNQAGLFVAMSNAYGGCFTTTDGTTWTGRALIGTANTGAAAVAYSAAALGGLGSFMTTFGNTTTASALSASSIDGVNWSQRGSFSSLGAWGAVAYGNGIWLALNYNGGAAAMDATANTWMTRPGPTGTGWSLLTFGAGIFVAGGGNGISTSSDGMTWSTPSTAAYPNALTYGNGVFVGQSTTSPVYAQRAGATATVSPGANNMYAVARDGAGNVSSRSPVLANLAGIAVSRSTGQLWPR